MDEQYGRQNESLDTWLCRVRDRYGPCTTVLTRLTDGWDALCMAAACDKLRFRDGDFDTSLMNGGLVDLVALVGGYGERSVWMGMSARDQEYAAKGCQTVLDTLARANIWIFGGCGRIRAPVSGPRISGVLGCLRAIYVPRNVFWIAAAGAADPKITVIDDLDGTTYFLDAEV